MPTYTTLTTGTPEKSDTAALAWATVLAVFVSLAGCASGPPLAVAAPGAVDAGSAPSGAGLGDLVVYSATFAPTLEEGEYPAHTDYTIATPSDKIIEHISNRTGSFDRRPATVRLVSGEYHVRAQYDRGGFVTIPVVIEAGKTTTVGLDGSATPQQLSHAAEAVRLPGGNVIGWKMTSE